MMNFSFHFVSNLTRIINFDALPELTLSVWGRGGVGRLAGWWGWVWVRDSRCVRVHPSHTRRMFGKNFISRLPKDKNPKRGTALLHNSNGLHWK